jgi:hypothetical protein
VSDERPAVHGYENDGSSWVEVGGERTSTPTLPGFLLARIAEDEARARALDAAYEADEVRPPGRLVNLFALVVPARVLAECEAKRRIVEQVNGMEYVLRLLALPYADHEDYRPEWRP